MFFLRLSREVLHGFIKWLVLFLNCWLCLRFQAVFGQSSVETVHRDARVTRNVIPVES